MPKQKLDNNITHTNIVTDVEITGVVINYEQGFTEVHYITFLEDGTPFQRGTVKGEDTDIFNPASLYARVLARVAI